MLKNDKICLIHLLWLLMAEGMNAIPSKEDLGAILGYPASEILITDVTSEERQVLELPSARERRAQNPKVLSGNQLVAAYYVRAKDPETFYPIIIFVAKEGTFLTEEVKKTLTDLSAAPDRPISKGGKGPLGDFKFIEASESGIYMGKVKRPSRDSAMSEPQERMAMVSVLRLATEPLDVRIAFMAALEKGVELKPISGGEQYFQNFGATAEESASQAAVVRGMVSRVNALVLADNDSPTAGIRERAKTARDSATKATGNERQQASNSSLMAGSSRWIWVVLGVIGLFLAFLVIPRKKKQ